jgi:hypothetical protein
MPDEHSVPALMAVAFAVGNGAERPPESGRVVKLYRLSLDTPARNTQPRYQHLSDHDD